MILVAAYSPALAEAPEQALLAGGIPFKRQTVESDDGIEETQFLVAEEDFDRAADILEKLQEKLDSDMDLSEVYSCPFCGRSGSVWYKQDMETGAVEVLLCACSDGRPVAVRNADTKRGGYVSHSEE